MNTELSNELITGIKIIDDQHKELLVNLDNFYTACINKKGRQEINKLMEYLELYILEHFKEEESAMKMHFYNGYVEHRMAHHKFIEKITAYKKNINTNNISLVMELNKFIRDWLVTHVKNEDVKMAEHLKKHI